MDATHQESAQRLRGALIPRPQHLALLIRRDDQRIDMPIDLG